MALVAVTDHVFPDLDQERRLLADAGHELRFGSNASSVEEVRDAVTARTPSSTASRRCRPR